MESVLGGGDGTATVFACVRFVQTFAEGTLGKFAVVIPAFVACSTIGSLNGSILGGSRYGRVKAGVYSGIHDINKL